MPGLTRRLRVFSRRTLWGTGMMLALAGLATVEMESASFGHGHLADEHTTYHHHIYLGQHEHSEAPHDQDHDHHHDQDHDQDHEAPAPHDGDAPHRTATLSVAPALFQPVDFSVLPVPLADSTPVVSTLVLPRVLRPEGRPVPPRAPPVSIPSPGSLS